MNEIPNKHIQALNLMVKEFVDLIKTHEHKYDRTFASTIKGINKDNTYTIMDDGGVERKVKCSAKNLESVSVLAGDFHIAFLSFSFAFRPNGNTFRPFGRE